MKTNVVPLVVKIASGGSLTPSLNINGRQLVGIEIPDALTEANLTFQASVDGTNFSELYSSGSAVGVTVPTSGSAGARAFLDVDPNLFEGIPYIKVRSGTSGSPVVQTAARSLKLMAKIK